jgi:tetratricopeptide (TPR) repeat protein
VIPRNRQLQILLLLIVPLLLPLSCRTWSSREELAAQAYNNGNALRDAGLQEEALIAYSEALEHEPDMSAAVYNKALTLVELDRTVEALELLQILNNQDPRNLTVLRAMGWAAWVGGMPDSALNYYRAVLVIFPADKGALRSTAEVYEAIGRHNDAVEMRQFLVVLEENTESRQDLAQTLTLSERYQEALDVYLDILAREPANQIALKGASVAAEETGQFHEALRFRLNLAGITSDDGESWWHIARLRLVEIGDYEGGLEALETSLNEGFNDDKALENLLLSSPPAVRPAVRNLLAEPRED